MKPYCTRLSSYACALFTFLFVAVKVTLTQPPPRSGSGRCGWAAHYLCVSQYVCTSLWVQVGRAAGAGERGWPAARSFTCNCSMWRTCYWHWAFNRAPAGPLNLRGSPWEQHRRAEEFSRVNVQLLLISAEKSHSLNSSPTFPAVARLWMVPQKKVNTLPCLLLFSLSCSLSLPFLKSTAG